MATPDDRLHMAISENNMNEVISAIDDGADANGYVPFYPDEDENIKWSFLYDAVDCENVEIIKYLILKGASINSVSGSLKWTPLHLAIFSDNIASVKILLENGALVEHARSIFDGTGDPNEEMRKCIESFEIPVKGVQSDDV